jgi:hypothetical protein
MRWEFLLSTVRTYRIARYYELRISSSDKVPISTAGMFPTLDLRPNNESAYASWRRHSVPGGNWILAVPQDDRTKTTQCPPERTTCIEDDANDAGEQQSTKKLTMMNIVVVWSLWMQQRSNFMICTCRRSESWCCFNVVAEFHAPPRRSDAVFS